MNQIHDLDAVSDDLLGSVLAALPANAPIFDNQRYVHLLHCGRPADALEHGVTMLARCQRANPTTYASLHKGTPFYWLGTAAYLIHDFQTAAYFYDAAVSEDLRGGTTPLPDSPAIKFVMLNGVATDQAARSLVMKLQSTVELAIGDYNTRATPLSPPLTIEELRSGFIKLALEGTGQFRSVATAFISFFLEADHRARLDKLVLLPGSREPQLVHLLKGAALFESLLKEKAPANLKTLGKIIGDAALQSALGIGSTQIALHKLSANTLSAAINLASGQPTSREDTVIVTAKIRNKVAHDFNWPLGGAEYALALDQIKCACLHVIARLYR